MPAYDDSDGWKFIPDGVHHGDDLPGSGNTFRSIEDVKRFARSPEYVGFTVYGNGIRRQVRFHSSLLEAEPHGKGECSPGCILYFHPGRLQSCAAARLPALPPSTSQVSKSSVAPTEESREVVTGGAHLDAPR